VTVRNPSAWLIFRRDLGGFAQYLRAGDPMR
jgi:hypothetical protein